MNGRLLRLLFGLLAWIAIGCTHLAAAGAEAGALGYPRPFSFRSVTPQRLPHMDWISMVVSDLHLRTRRGAEIEFKRRYPSRPVLVQINSEGLGLWGTWICLPLQCQEDLGLRSSRSLEVWRMLPMLT